MGPAQEPVESAAWPCCVPFRPPLRPPHRRHRRCRCSALRVVQPLAAERLYLSSDVGRLREELEAEFASAAFDFAAVPPGQPWWHDEAQGADGQLEAAAGAESLDLIEGREPPGGLMHLHARGSGVEQGWAEGVTAARSCAQRTDGSRLAPPAPPRHAKQARSCAAPSASGSGWRTGPSAAWRWCRTGGCCTP